MRILGAAFLLALVGCASATPPATPPALPNQAHRVLEEFPSAREFGEEGWVLSGGAHREYVVRRDAGGWLLAPIGSTYGHGTWMRSISAHDYAGKRVRITIDVRTQHATNRVDVRSRAQAIDSPADGSGLGGDTKNPPPDSTWSMYVMVLDVPDRTAKLQSGVGIAGPGQLWMRHPKLKIVGEDVAITRRAKIDARWLDRNDSPIFPGDLRSRSRRLVHRSHDHVHDA